MFNFDQMSWYGIIALAFLPTFILASLIRVKGIFGVLVIIGIASIFLVILSDFQGWNMALAAVSALVGMTLGGNISDARERKRLVEKRDEDKKLRDERMRGS